MSTVFEDPRERFPRGNTILIIDDEPANLGVISDYLGNFGLEVLIARDGKSGLQKAQYAQPDLILLDVLMPEIDGFETCRRLKAKETTKDIPVIFMTALDETRDKVKGFQLGAVDYIIKPFQPKEALARITTHLRLRELTERLENKVQERTKELTVAVREAKRLNRQLQQEVAERRRTEEEVRQRNRELALLNRVIAAATSTLDMEQVLHVACQELAQAFGLPQAMASMTNAQGTEFNVVAEYLEPGRPSSLGESMVIRDNAIVKHVLEHKKAVAVIDADTDERLVAVHDLMRERNTASLLIMPLITRGKVTGAIILEAMERRKFSEDEVSLARNVTAAVGQALETAQLHQQLQRHVTELARALERQQELDRLKNEFIQNVSHELRTPLAIARGYVELLEKGSLGELQPIQRKPVNVAARRLRMLSELVEEINTILEMEEKVVEPEAVEFGDLVHAMLINARAAAEDNDLTLEEDLTADLPPLSGDPVLLVRMVDNLVDNAIKFTPAGGHVAVRLWQEDGELVFEVADTGIGIPADQLDLIFERFYQVDGSVTRRYGGAGLGLALVKEIAKAHGGRVTVESQVGQGSTFTIWLPLNGAAPHRNVA